MCGCVCMCVCSYVCICLYVCVYVSVCVSLGSVCTILEYGLDDHVSW